MRGVLSKEGTKEVSRILNIYIDKLKLHFYRKHLFIKTDKERGKEEGRKGDGAGGRERERA